MRLIVNGKEEQPCKKVKLYEHLTEKEIKTLMIKVRDEQNSQQPPDNKE